MRRLLGPGLIALAMLAILIGLGTWQIYRLHWKEGILAQIARAEAAPPVPLHGDPTPFTKVAVTGRLRADLSASYGDDVRDMPAGPVMGSFLIQPLERPGHPPLLVDLGWVPQHPPAPIAQPPGETTIVGFVHQGEKPGFFAAGDDPAARAFYTLDPQKIGASLGLPHVAPFILVAMGPAPPQRWPDPARHLPRPPNNHLNYAITWYSLAITLVVMFVIRARKALRE
ncbi:MAG TPA: SURF1 family protein, partial [Acetobacteraceae bacterium]|jgi:surfeit locus 1 family protein|nr:SURF1 family protein [Acetobacteraceae bacterium]